MDITGSAGASRWRFLYTGAGPSTGTNTFSEAMCILTEGANAGNVGIGTTSPDHKLDISGSLCVDGFASPANNYITLRNSFSPSSSGGSGFKAVDLGSGNDDGLGAYGHQGIIFYSAQTERARITSGGNLLVGKTASNLANAGIEIFGAGYGQFTASSDASLFTNRLASDGDTVKFYRQTSLVGSISVTTTLTSYNVTSDYRLKNTIAPMTGALAKVALLKPCTYKWNVNGSDGEGFIAHELAEVVPHAVTGAKDAVDADGNPVHQAIDVSFLVATLTSAIQELKAEFDAYKASHP
jgi:hypothetical protein